VYAFVAAVSSNHADAIDIVQVVTQAGEEVFFKIKRNTKLMKLQSAYANKVGKDVGTIRYAPRVVGFIYQTSHAKPSSFLYDGNRINEDDTPATLEMEDNGTHIDRLYEVTTLLTIVIGRHHRRYG
jgi:hypothetical protein